jgi:hypothetical protein
MSGRVQGDAPRPPFTKRGLTMLTREEIRSVENARYDTYEEAELNANDLANDDLDAYVIEIGDKFAVKVIA